MKMKETGKADKNLSDEVIYKLEIPANRLNPNLVLWLTPQIRSFVP
jgi:hypothetical protein